MILGNRNIDMGTYFREYNLSELLRRKANVYAVDSLIKMKLTLLFEAAYTKNEGYTNPGQGHGRRWPG